MNDNYNYHVGFEPSAFKHGVGRDDIDHALSNPIVIHYYAGYVMVIGPSRSGDLLEVAVNVSGRVFHAMKARPKYLRRR